MEIKGIVGLESGIEFVAECDFQPAERMTRDYPGCDAELEINLPIILVRRNGEEVDCWNEHILNLIEQDKWELLEQLKMDYEADRADFQYQCLKEEGLI